MSEVLIVSRNADGLWKKPGAGSDLQEFYERMKDFDPTHNVFFMEHRRQLIAYAANRWWEEANANFVHKTLVVFLRNRRARSRAKLVKQCENVPCGAKATSTRKAPGTGFKKGLHLTHKTTGTAQLEDLNYARVRYFYDMVCRQSRTCTTAETPPGIEMDRRNPNSIIKFGKPSANTSTSMGRTVEEESSTLRHFIEESRI